MSDYHPQSQSPPRPTSIGSAYSFAVEVAPDGTQIVVITEVRQVGNRSERHRVVVGESALAGFVGGLQAVVDALGSSSTPRRAYSVKKFRSQHPKAYAPWSPADDQRLLTRYRQGDDVAELSREFGRQKSAIRSRLTRLGAKAIRPFVGSESPGLDEKRSEPVSK